MADPVVDPIPAVATTPMLNEKPWLSKRIWVNVLVALGGFFPVIQNFMSDNPQALMLVFSGINILLTLITKDKVSLQD